MKDISPESLAARDGNIQEGDVVLKVRGKTSVFVWPEMRVFKVVKAQ